MRFFSPSPRRLRDSWPGPALEDFDDLARVQAAVCKQVKQTNDKQWQAPKQGNNKKKNKKKKKKKKKNNNNNSNDIV